MEVAAAVDGDDGLTLEALPIECLVEVLTYLTAAELLNCAEVSTAMREAAEADVLWRNLCVRGSHGQSLDFKESLGSFMHPDAKPLVQAADTDAHAADGDGVTAPPDLGVQASAASTTSSTASWRSIYSRSISSLRTTVCVDTGRGYAKVGFAISDRPLIVQICQPGAEATQESLFPLTFRKLGMRRADLSEHAIIVSEPFRLAAADVERERASWRYETERRILQGFQVWSLNLYPTPPPSSSSPQSSPSSPPSSPRFPRRYR